MIRRLLLLFSCVVLFAGAASGQSGGAIWQQTEGGADHWGPSQVSRDPAYSVNAELADDFDLTGSVSEISAGGYNGHIGSPNFPPPFYGVHVRFYAAGEDGKPGALQAEYFLEAGDPGLWMEDQVPNSFRMKLEPPFAASGKHFVSVQPEMDPVFLALWYWGSANTGAPRGNGAWYRDRQAPAATWTRDFGYRQMNTDLSFTLYGTRVTPAPRLTALSEASLPLSGRLRITGEGFGFNRENSVVRVGGVEALVTRWTDTVIHAYVPEGAPTGSTQVEVVTAGGTSNSLPLQVSERATDGRVRWRFRADGTAVYSRPVVSPDGTVYAADVKGHLYALTPGGGLKWVYNGDPVTCAQPLAVSADGTVYMAVGATLIAVNPDGTERWRVKDPTGQPIFAGPNVGPDGNIYAASSDLPAGDGLGLFCVSPSGALIWNRPGFRGSTGWYGSGQEIRFGSGQLYLTAQNGLGAYSLGGTPRWTRAGWGQCSVGPDGTLYVNITGQQARVAAYGPDGSARGAFSSALAAPVAGPDGTVYVGEGEQLGAYDRTGTPRWRVSDHERVLEPGVSPVNTLVVVPVQSVYERPCYLDGISLSGAPLWRLTLPVEDGAPVYPVSRPRFTPEGSSVYVGMTGSQYKPGDASWLYAVDTAPEPGVELPFLSVRPERVGGGFSAGGVVTLPQPAGQGGVTVTLTSDSTRAKVPATVTVLEGLRSASFTITTSAVSQLTPVTLTATHLGESHTATLTVAPPGPHLVELERWGASGGDTFSGTVTLNGPAPSAGLKVALRSSSPLVKVPASVTVPGGATSVNFGVSVSSSRGEREAEITASANGLSASETFWVYPVWLEGVGLQPDPAVGGDAVEGIVVLSGPAPEGGLTVFLESENPALLTLPTSVLVPEGELGVTFSAQTGTVTSPAAADFWAFTEEDVVGSWIDLLPVEGTDLVEVQSAAHSSARGQLTVEAVVREPAAARGVAAAAARKPPILTAYNTTTGKAIGKLVRGKNGRYKLILRTKVRPERITVRTSRGGAATRAVSGH